MHPLIKYLLSFRLLYIVGGGFFFYLLSVFIDPVFIPTLQMPENWCQKWIETRSGYQTVYQMLLPPPVEWMPEEFLEIRRARIEYVLETIE